LLKGDNSFLRGGFVLPINLILIAAEMNGEGTIGVGFCSDIVIAIDTQVVLRNKAIGVVNDYRPEGANWSPNSDNTGRSPEL